MPLEKLILALVMASKKLNHYLQALKIVVLIEHPLKSLLQQGDQIGKSNGQAKASNKTILDGIKKRLEAAKGKWVEELPNVLWAYRTTPRRSTGESPFSMAYGTEVVIPLEVGIPGIKTHGVENGTNEAFLARDLDLLEEGRERTTIRLGD
ncbi:uncharacterized protein LOC114267198 [Camellia sinensis]|uniref:uncharacterized protein LOC114267198 n=1 Tax=Camellia sinensis TaxID=4442 RepID=UPI0010365D9C|nr:uncharacterized protein LOC114267198 [Camellia sinensis]